MARMYTSDVSQRVCLNIFLSCLLGPARGEATMLCQRHSV
jgi:hypothetical protein